MLSSDDVKLAPYVLVTALYNALVRENVPATSVSSYVTPSGPYNALIRSEPCWYLTSVSRIVPFPIKLLTSVSVKSLKLPPVICKTPVSESNSTSKW